ncbi:hypothetical protein AB1L42_09465 [Thalassoglobus sp. JC818]|uniref:anti-sigma factor family protein n=1 Tax=Thalassoglobus sp. JC818 TaxID=3232136 RepID=UPI00345A808A
MDKLSRLTPEDRENLIAYLDGELDEQATRRMESMLVESSVARNDVEVLSRTYDLLDELPRPNAPNDFVERTVATAKMEHVSVPLSKRRWFRTSTQILTLCGWTCVIVASAALGSMVSDQYFQSQDDVLIEKLPVIRSLDVYYEVDNLEFLNRLSAETSLLDEMSRESNDE